LANYVKNADEVGKDAHKLKLLKPEAIYKHYVLKDKELEEEVHIKVSPRMGRACVFCGTARNVDENDDDWRKWDY